MDSTPQTPHDGNEKTRRTFEHTAPKSPLKSRGIIGALAVITATAAQSAGLEIGEAETSDLIFAAVQLIGGLLALVGRWKATRRIGQ